MCAVFSAQKLINVTWVSTLQHTATHCNTLQHTATHCNTLQHTATHCNTLQHTATLPTLVCAVNSINVTRLIHTYDMGQHTATHCNSLQHTLQHTATHCNILQHIGRPNCCVSFAEETQEKGPLYKKDKADLRSKIMEHATFM